MSLLDNVLIEQHLASILDHPASGLSTLIQDSRIDDLKLLYTLFGRVGKGHPVLQAGVSAWIVAIGKQINEGVSLAPEPETRAEDAKGKGKATDEGEGLKKKPEAGGAINAKTKAALAWVQNVLDLKDKFDTLLAKAFASDKAFEKSINDVRLFVRAHSSCPDPFERDRPSPSLSTRTASRPSTSRSSSTTICGRVSRGCVSQAFIDLSNV